MLPFLVFLTMLQPLSGTIGPLGCGKGRMKTYDTGAVIPTVASGEGWTNPEGALVVYDNEYASHWLRESETTLPLAVSGFACAAPSDAKIVGVIARIFVDYAIESDFTLQLRDISGLIGDAKVRHIASDEIPFPAGAWISVGSASDNWGAALTPAIVNSAEFGIDMIIENLGSFDEGFRIDAIELTIYYKSRHKP